MSNFRWDKLTNRLTVFVTVLALMFGSCFTTAAAYQDNTDNVQGTQLSDIQNHWARQQILDWSQKSLIAGYEDGTFRPEKEVTRAEFTALVNRAYGLTQQSRAAFSDVSPGDWFSEEIAKAVAAGYISGYSDGTMRPAAGISRQEAAVILYRLLRLISIEDESWVDEFSDSDSIAGWSREYVNAAVAGGYLSGYPDATFKPERILTRAETVALLSKAVGRLYNTPGTYGPEETSQAVAGNVTVNTADVVLQNLIIDGDLFLTAGIGEGNFEANNVIVKGRTVVSGGGEESVVFNNTSLEEVIVFVVDGKVRVVAKGDTDIETLIMQSGGHLQEDDLNGDGFGDVQIMVLKPGENIELEGDFDRVSIETTVDVSITGETRIGELEVTEDADGTEINTGKDTIIETLTLNAATEATGKGTIEIAYVNTDDYSFETDPDKLVIYGKEKKSSSGGGSGGSKNVTVSGISINQPDDLLTVGNTLQLTVTFSPTNATNKRVTWTSDNEEAATVDENGVVTAIDVGTATITVTTADGGKTDTVKITVPVLVGEDAEYKSIQDAVDEADPGDTILVEAGEYEEDLTINKEGLILKTYADAKVNGNIVITADNVTIDGFTVEDEGGSYVIIRIDGTTGVTIQNNIIIQTDKERANPVIGSLDNTGVGDVIIRNNNLTGAIGLYLNTDATAKISENTIDWAFDEGIWVGPLWTQEGYTLIIEDNEITGFGADKAPIAVHVRPGSLNGQTEDYEMYTAILEDNQVDTVWLGWIKIVAGDGSIQAAIDAANEDDTILVEIGEYTEDLTISKKGLTIKSLADPDQTTILGDTINITADSVTIEGFTIDNNGGQRAIAPRNSDGTIIKNNIIINSYRGIQGDYYGRPANLSIIGNTFETDFGIAGTEDMKGLLIEGNTFKTTAEGIGLGDGVQLYGCSGDYIEYLLGNNTFQEDSGGVVDYRSVVYNTTRGEGYSTIQAAIDGADKSDIIMVADGDYTVTDSVYIDEEITLITKDAVIIADGLKNAFEICSDNVVIDGFNITNDGETNNWGIQVYRGYTGIDIRNNTFEGVNMMAVYFNRKSGGTVENNHINATRKGIGAQTDESLTIKGNTIIGTTLAIELYIDDPDTGTGDNFTLKDNTLEGNHEDIIKPNGE